MKGDENVFPGGWTLIGYAIMIMIFILLVVFVAGGQHAVSNNIAIGG